jgi:alkanesulfonate monooxygenase SsuD/methylene tetrahydromethanopterin reductase-like flavin-dependent oxidoreductase (luciferase family)
VIKLGVTLPQFTSDPRLFVDGIYRAEAAGLDSIWVFDHLWPLTGGKERPILECFTALTWAATRSKRTTVGTLVTRSSLRHPALLAHMVKSVAGVAPGRVVLAVGSGDDKSKLENVAFGLDYFDGDARAEQLGSTVRTVRAETEVPVWVAGGAPAACKLAGEHADGWNAWAGSPESFVRRATTVRAAAAGRDVELTWAGLVLLADSDAEAERRMGGRDRRDWIWGGPETVAAWLTRYVEAGATHLICVFPDAGKPGAYETLAREVGPALGISHPA